MGSRDLELESGVLRDLSCEYSGRDWQLRLLLMGTSYYDSSTIIPFLLDACRIEHAAFMAI